MGAPCGGAQLALTCVGVPILRAQGLAKCFGLDSAPRSAWHFEDAAVHHGGVAIAGSPQISVHSSLETSIFTAFGLFELRDDSFGVRLAGNSAAVRIARPSFGK